MKNVKYVSMTEGLTLYLFLYSFGASWTDINSIFSKLKFGSIVRTMKVCYLVILLFLITVVNRAGAGNYESNSSVSNFANVSGPRVRSSKNHNVWKLLKMSHMNSWHCPSICPIKIDLSVNTVWPQASGFQKLVKIDLFGLFVNFCPLKI